LLLLLLHAAARAAGCCLLLKLVRLLRLLLQPHLFSATLFVNLELSYWLADAPVLQSGWLKLVWLPAAAAAAAPGCASCAAADATMMLRHLLLLLLLLHAAACVAAVNCCCFQLRLLLQTASLLQPHFCSSHTHFQPHYL
jgi:hypothetical protein